jgi:hypothetical protein
MYLLLLIFDQSNFTKTLILSYSVPKMLSVDDPNVSLVGGARVFDFSVKTMKHQTDTINFKR